MADLDLPLLPSVLDRLIDDAPDQPRDPARHRGQHLAMLRDAVRRDLEALLNTPRRCLSPPPGLKELDQSLVEYGIPDLLSANAGAGGAREALRAGIEQTIRRFEPRFKAVTVTLIDSADRTDRTLRLRIDVLMHVEPAPEPMSFDSYLNPASHHFSVEGRRHG
jgi:type VI secretion system protein ImpF